MFTKLTELNNLDLQFCKYLRENIENECELLLESDLDKFYGNINLMKELINTLNTSINEPGLSRACLMGIHNMNNDNIALIDYFRAYDYAFKGIKDGLDLCEKRNNDIWEMTQTEELITNK